MKEGGGRGEGRVGGRRGGKGVQRGGGRCGCVNLLPLTQQHTHSHTREAEMIYC